MNRSLGGTPVERSPKRICRREEGNAAFDLGGNANDSSRKVGHAFRTASIGSLLNLNGGPCRGCCAPSNVERRSQPSSSTVATDSGPKYTDIDQSDAKRQIQLICRTPACWRGEKDQTHMLYLLRRFPALASQLFDWDYNLFWEHGNEWSSPLSFLLVAGAGLEIVQAVYDLYPAALWQPSGIHRDLPLHFACRFGVSEDILMFLLRRFPVAVTVSNLSGMLPIHCAMGKKDITPYGKFQHARLETIQVLLQVYPQSLLKEESEHQYTPLQIAFNHGYSFQVLDYMISMLPKQVGEFELIAGCYHKLFGVKLDLAESVVVSRLLPRLQRFHCQPTRWEKGGLVKLLACMKGNKTTNEFRASNIPNEILQDGAVSNSLSTLLDHNNTLEKLSLEMRKEDREGADTTAFIRSLDRVFRYSQHLKTLELSNFSTTIGTLTSFLASKNVPEVLILNKLVLLRDSNETSHNYHCPDINSKLRKLVVSGCRFLRGEDDSNSLSSLPFLTLLNFAARLSQLKELRLGLPHFKELDITDPLVHLLLGGSLENLTVRGPLVRMEPFCASLQHNTTLRRFDFPKGLETKVKRGLLVQALENHNATLQSVRIANSSCVQDEKEYKKILWYTQLNQFGRAKVRNPNATKASVVNLLQDCDTSSPNCNSHQKLNIQYGLLRESPGLWV